MQKKLLILILTVFISVALEAQEYLDKPGDNRTAFGLFGALNLNMHTGNFIGVNFPQVPSCCPRYETGTGIGFTGGIFYDIPLSKDLVLGIRALYTDLSGTLKKDEPTWVTSIQGTTVDGTFEHTVKGTISGAGLMPTIGYRLFENFRLDIGVRGLYIMSAKYDQKEHLISPSYGVFPDTKKTTRNEFTGDVKSPSTPNISGVIGGNYSLPLNSSGTLFLVPELYYYFGITKLASDLDWKIGGLTGGLAIKYSPRKVKPPKVIPPPPPPPPLPPPPPPPEVPVLDASIAAVAVDSGGVESSIAKLRVEQFLSSRMHPLLNYVFFDINSSELTDRYKKMSSSEKSQFTEKKLYQQTTMDVYHNVLNIVGKRVAQYPQAELTLIGCNSDQGPEKGNLDLSKKRAQIVKDYLVNIWGIQENRIKIQNKNLPEVPSNITNQDGQEENRRVEIISNIPDIFKPLIVQDTLIESNPPVFRFKPTVKTKIGIQSWKIITSQSNGDVKTFSGVGNPPEKIEWDLTKEKEVVPRLDEPLNYRLSITDMDNKVLESPLQQLPVEQYTIEKKILEQIQDKEIDKFSLILFDYNKSYLGEANTQIADFAKKRIQPNSTVNITGYTDRSGDEKLNMKLSQDRATNTAKALGVDPKKAKGIGKSILLYPNDTPEGRFYCRTVNIEIVTPITY